MFFMFRFAFHFLDLARKAKGLLEELSKIDPENLSPEYTENEHLSDIKDTGGTRPVRMSSLEKPVDTQMRVPLRDRINDIQEAINARALGVELKIEESLLLDEQQAYVSIFQQIKAVTQFSLENSIEVMFVDQACPRDLYIKLKDLSD